MISISSFIISSSLLLVGRQTLTRQALGAAFTTMAASSKQSNDTPSLTSLQSYYQLLVDDSGETFIMKRDFKDVEEQGYSNTPQLVKKLNPAFAKPTDIVFTQLAGENPWHHCPSPQLVICVRGGWYVMTTDGRTQNLLPGDVLYQDNTEQHPLAKPDTRQAMHFSGSLHNEPCDQVIIQLQLTDGFASSKDEVGPL